MARPIKQGMDYFPLDVDFFEDEKIEYVTARFGEKGELLAIKLLCDIYRNGYFTKWNEDKATIFAKRAGNNISPSLVNDVVEELVKRGFFEKSIFNSFGVLTSRGIQKRYSQATLERKEVEIIQDIWLLDFPEDTKKTKYKVNRPINGVNPPINAINPPINSQSKVKESKVNKKDKDMLNSISLVGYRQRYNPDQLKTIDSFFDVLKHTRKSARLADTVIAGIYKSWERHDVEKVLYALSKYIREPSLQDKNEKYVLGIMNNATKAEIEGHKNYQKDGRKSPQQAYSKTTTNRFANFPQRTWDFDKIERAARAELDRL